MDLDGALTGETVNFDIIQNIVSKFNLNCVLDLLIFTVFAIDILAQQKNDISFTSAQ